MWGGFTWIAMFAMILLKSKYSVEMLAWIAFVKICAIWSTTSILLSLRSASCNLRCEGASWFVKHLVLLPHFYEKPCASWNYDSWQATVLYEACASLRDALRKFIRTTLWSKQTSWALCGHLKKACIRSWSASWMRTCPRPVKQVQQRWELRKFSFGNVLHKALLTKLQPYDRLTATLDNLIEEIYCLRPSTMFLDNKGNIFP